ncbi:hypothetical protein RUM43_001673 [Polyplax serrata]|uniref:HELP domain-containing protein n=1 Tax=Polyplax serrata TaxID=468196 RepID=A0AAN8SGK8_POLSC
MKASEIAGGNPTNELCQIVYGYRGRDCRSNLYFLPTGEMVYFIAAVVVLYNVEEQSQRHYLGHTDDVKCLAIHPNKMLVATGQCAGHDRKDAKVKKAPHIRIWNSVSLNTVATIGMNEFEKSICCLTFSKVDGGALLCAIDESMDHTITVWDWQKKERGAKLTENKCSVDTVIAAEFHPLDRHCIVTCGKSHIAFWILDQNGTLYKRMGIFENRDKPKYVTCLAFTQDGDTLSGDSNGNIIVWGRGTNTIMKLIRGVHDSTIFSICALKDGVIITGGGKDGKLVLLNSEYLPVDEGYIGEQFGGVRQISESRGSQLLVGTTKNCILIGSFQVGFSPVINGHTEEIWACATHPNLPQFLTAGFDGIVHLWDSLAHSLVWTKDISEPIQCIRFSPDGSIVIVGLCNGKWCVLDCGRREILCSYQDGSEPIQDCKFSPDKTTLALGSRDNTIYIYQASPDFTNYHKVGRCVGHSSFITHIDWSSDSQYLRSNSGDYELLYWQASICRQITQTSSMKDTDWATNDCTITFNTLGIWQDGMDGTDINNCARSNSSKLLVTGDDFGKLKLYTYPVIHPKSLFHTAGGHSSHVTNVEFLNDDSRILSVGGKDTSVMQWKIC